MFTIDFNIDSSRKAKTKGVTHVPNWNMHAQVRIYIAGTSINYWIRHLKFIASYGNDTERGAYIKYSKDSVARRQMG